MSRSTLYCKKASAGYRVNKDRATRLDTRLMGVQRPPHHETFAVVFVERPSRRWWSSGSVRRTARSRPDCGRIRDRIRVRRRDDSGDGRRSRSRLGWRRRSRGSSSCDRRSSGRSASCVSRGHTAGRTSCRSNRWWTCSGLCSRNRHYRTCLHTATTLDNSTVFGQHKPPRRQPSSKVIPDSNPDFRINPDVCRIVSTMLWIHYLVGVSHFAECRANRPSLHVWEMLINLLKSSIPQWRWKCKSNPESVSGTASPPKVNKFFRLAAIIFNKLSWVW